MLRHRIEDSDAARSQDLSDIFDLVGLAVERARYHQERARRIKAFELRRQRSCGRLAEHNLVHRAENDTPFVHAPVLPQHVLACLAAM